MSEIKPEISIQGTSVTYIGDSNFIPDQKDTALAYDSFSYTVGVVPEAADSEPHGAPSRPLNPNAVRTLDSVLQSHGESNILRDTSGEF